MNDRSLAIALFALLERENTVSIPQIAQLLGSSEEAIWELLEDLVFAYDSVDVRLELGGAYARLQREGTSRILRLSPDETDALLDALTAYGFTPDGDLARKLLATKGFLSAVEGGAEAAPADPNSKDSEEPASPMSLGRMRTTVHGSRADIVEAVAAACEDEAHHVLEILYYKEGAAQPQTHLLEPARISEHDDHAVLEAYDQGRDAWRSFRLDRIVSARALERHFTPRGHSSAGAEGAEAEAAPVATLRFTAGTPLPDWPGLRKTRTLADGQVEARIVWYGSMWLPKRIVALFGKAVPVSPPELKQACAEYAGHLLAQA